MPPHFLSNDELKAFHDKRITVEQFSTLTNACPLLTEFPQASVRVQSLFNPDGTFNADAKKKVSQDPHNNPIDGFSVLDSFKDLR